MVVRNFSHSLTIFLIVVISFTFALKCFVCNSAHDENCDANPVPEQYLVNCTSNSAKPIFRNKSELIKSFRNSNSTITENDTLIHNNHFISSNMESWKDVNFTFCRKDDIEIPYQSNGPDFKRDATRRIIRSCGWLGVPSKKNCRLLPNQIMIQCSCTDDACNSSQILSSITCVLLPLILGIKKLLVI